MAIPIRFIMIAVIFFSTYVNYMLRVNISVSIIAMTIHKKKSKSLSAIEESDTAFSNDTSLYKKNSDIDSHIYNDIEFDEFDYDETSIMSRAAGEKKYNWSEKAQNLILSAHGMGYIVLSLPAGFICEYFGSIEVLVASCAVCAVLNSLTPMFAEWGPNPVVALRIGIGLMSAFAYPAAQTLVAAWAPPDEKGKFLSALLGNTIGIMITWPLVGTISEDWSWVWGFHVISIMTVAYCVGTRAVATNRPESHWCITPEELKYIKDAQGNTVSGERRVPPYKDIFFSIRFWAVSIAQFCNLWGLFLYTTESNKFLVQAMNFKLKESGFISALPFLSRFFGAMVFGSVCDFLRKRELLRVVNIRRLACFFSHILSGCCLACIPLCGRNHVAVVTMLILGQFCNSAVVAGHLLNNQDLAPNFAGTLHGIMNFLATATSFFVPILCGILLEGKDSDDLGPWHIIYVIGGCVYWCGGVVFILLCTADLQPWNG